MSTQNQQNWNHHFMSLLAQDIYFTRLLTFKKHLFKYNLITMKNTRNCTFHIFIKHYTLWGLQQNLVHKNWTSRTPLMIFQSWHSNLNKWTSFSLNSGWQLGPSSQTAHVSVTRKQSNSVGWLEFADGELLRWPYRHYSNPHDLPHTMS